MLKHADVVERQQMEKVHKLNEQQLQKDELARERMSNSIQAARPRKLMPG